MQYRFTGCCRVLVMCWQEAVLGGASVSRALLCDDKIAGVTSGKSVVWRQEGMVVYDNLSPFYVMV